MVLGYRVKVDIGGKGGAGVQGYSLRVGLE